MPDDPSPGSGTCRRTPSDSGGTGVARLLRRVGDRQLGADQAIALIILGLEAELVADAQHALVLRQDHGADTLQLLIAADGDEPTEDLGTQSAPLEPVADLDGELGLAFAIQSAQPPHADDLAFPG